MIDYKGKCKKCNCPTSDHMHAKYKYVEKEKETEEFAGLKRQIANIQKLGTNKEELIKCEKQEVEKLEQAIDDRTKEIKDYLEEYRKVSIGPGYVKLLTIQLDHINQDLETIVTLPEKEKLEAHKKEILSMIEIATKSLGK